jgi:hypothetical protein
MYSIRPEIEVSENLMYMFVYVYKFIIIHLNIDKKIKSLIDYYFKTEGVVK